MSLIIGAGSLGLEKILADGQALLDEAQQLMEQTEAAQGLVAQNKSAAQQAATSAANLATAVTLMVHAINQIGAGNSVNIDTLLISLTSATNGVRQTILDVQNDVNNKLSTVQGLTNTATEQANLAVANRTVWRGAWAPDTDYMIGDEVSTTAGSTYRSKTNHRSGATFAVGSNWDIKSLGGAVLTDGAVSRAKLDTPLQSVIDSFVVDNEGGFDIEDPLGFLLGQFLPNGTLVVRDLDVRQQASIKDLKTGSLNGITLIDDGLETLCLLDENGWVGYEKKLDGTVLAAGGSSGATNRLFGLLGDVNQYDSYSQSLGLGTSGSPVTTTTEPGIYTFHKGPVMYLYDADATRFDSLDLEVESGTESPVGAMGRMIKQSISADGIVVNGSTFTYDIVVSAPGQGNTAIAGLSKGTAPYTRLLAGVTAAKNLANNAGKTYNYGGFFWLQGEADNTAGTSRDIYKSLLKKLQSDFAADVKAITGQANSPVIVTYQTASHNVGSKQPNIALAQLDCGLTSGSGIYMGPTMYPYLYSSDQIHLGAGSEYLKVGALAGYIMKRIVVDGVEWKPISLKSWTFLGNTVQLKFNVPVKPLVIDTVAITDPGNAGFRLFNSAGAEQTITAVAVVRPDTVKITASAPIVAGMKLTYGINGTAEKSGPTQGSRGCLRDSQGAGIVYATYPLHNWTPIFQTTL